MLERFCLFCKSYNSTLLNAKLAVLLSVDFFLIFNVVNVLHLMYNNMYEVLISKINNILLFYNSTNKSV